MFSQEFVSTSPNKARIQTEEEKMYISSKIAKFKNAILEEEEKPAFYVVYLINGKIYGQIVNCDIFSKRFCFHGKQKTPKLLSPVGKNQLLSLVGSQYIEERATIEQFENWMLKSRKTYKNVGQAMEYFLKHLDHKTFNHTASLENGGDHYKRWGYTCEVKTCNFTNTSGTAQAYCGSRDTVK